MFDRRRDLREQVSVIRIELVLLDGALRGLVAPKSVGRVPHDLKRLPRDVAGRERQSAGVLPLRPGVLRIELGMNFLEDDLRAFQQLLDLPKSAPPFSLRPF